MAAADKANVTITEWDTPPKDSHPHDPLAAADGSLWYTGQYANKLGRLDLKTGEIQEWTLKTADSGPHGLTKDKEGNIWFTANSKGHIGKLNPKTGAVTEYPMPDPTARDPHTPLFDTKGILWFTVQQGNFVGKLEPATGNVTLKQSPTPNSKPYGIAHQFEKDLFLLRVAPDDRVYYSDYARGFLGRLDPAKIGRTLI